MCVVGPKLISSVVYVPSIRMYIIHYTLVLYDVLKVSLHNTFTSFVNMRTYVRDTTHH